ncbi:hypothetical protein EEZ25_10835 [Micromonospora aurantiaca]|nr:hypothetical protein EEZ25_10835 [Micromonospora aurantiaca]
MRWASGVATRPCGGRPCCEEAAGPRHGDGETVIAPEPARQIAEEFLDTEIRYRFPHPVVIVDDAVKELDDVYVFPYDGKAYVESGDWREAMAGNSPIAVDKRTGEARFSA